MVTVSNAQIAAIPGWFGRIDVAAFRMLLQATQEQVGTGDLAEIGVYQGRSAALIGSFQRPGETFTVIDLFGSAADEDANARENENQYATLTRWQFEENYERLHGTLPVVVTGYSATIVDHAAHGTHRFVHVDASHLYEHVVQDIEAARTLLHPEGVLVLDDFRTPHTPGVAAAAWQAVGVGLRPFLLTPVKMYATWGDAAPYLAATTAWADRGGDVHEVQRINGCDVILVSSNTPALARYLPPALIPGLRRLRARIS